jgi:hypothetical protein
MSIVDEAGSRISSGSRIRWRFESTFWSVAWSGGGLSCPRAAPSKPHRHMWSRCPASPTPPQARGRWR